MYGASAAGVAGQTIAGTATEAQPSAPSLACLSCHDGVSAINSIVNAPGSGGYTAGGANVAFGDTAAGSAKVMPNGVTQIGDGDPSGIGLTNDHPVSITYVPGAASLKPTDTAITGWSGATTIAGLLRAGKVECGSCHDPHLGESDTFLRRNAATVGEASNKGSKVCLTCHDK
ncbi:cytochrome c3 family protein [Hydrogenimonas sp.]